MNAPKEYYPVGYDKNFDDNFKSKIDLPATSFHCGDQKHFPGLYGDQDLGCMVSRQQRTFSLQNWLVRVCKKLCQFRSIRHSFLITHSRVFCPKLMLKVFTSCTRTKTLYQLSRFQFNQLQFHFNSPQRETNKKIISNRFKAFLSKVFLLPNIS